MAGVARSVVSSSECPSGHHVGCDPTTAPRGAVDVDDSVFSDLEMRSLAARLAVEVMEPRHHHSGSVFDLYTFDDATLHMGDWTRRGAAVTSSLPHHHDHRTHLHAGSMLDDDYAAARLAAIDVSSFVDQELPPLPDHPMQPASRRASLTAAAAARRLSSSASPFARQGSSTGKAQAVAQAIRCAAAAAPRAYSLVPPVHLAFQLQSNPAKCLVYPDGVPLAASVAA